MREIGAASEMLSYLQHQRRASEGLEEREQPGSKRERGSAETEHQFYSLLCSLCDLHVGNELQLRTRYELINGCQASEGFKEMPLDTSS